MPLTKSQRRAAVKRAAESTKPAIKAVLGRDAEIVAYAFRSGQLGFAGRELGVVPDGALVICSGTRAAVESAVNGLSRLAYDNITRLVPGIPEAGYDEEKALNALLVFQARVRTALDRHELSR